VLFSPEEFLTMNRWFVFLPLLGGLLAAAQGDAAELKVGDAAPSFSLPGSDGKTYKLADLKGKVVVIAWFPKAFTGG
jgi:peroxiredoxin Q/BCP